MAHRTTVILPDDLHAAWKASRLLLTEVIRRGLDGTGDTARHAATESRLAMIEHRIAQLEARQVIPSSYADADDTADQLSDEEHERLRAEYHNQTMNDRRTLLLAKVPHADGEPVVIDTTAAVAVFGVNDQTARSWMKALTGYGYARQLDRKEGTGQRYEWVIEPDTETAE
jgi:hypothetical protein